MLGFPRCGTTALAYALAKHPDVFCCEPKEPHFLAFGGGEPAIEGPGREAFSAERVYSQKEWEQLFYEKDHKYLMDASVTTVSYPGSSLENIEKYCGSDCKAIVMLRDPVDRAYSSYLYNLSRGWEAGSFEEGLDEEENRRSAKWQHLWQFKWLSDYEHRMAPFEKYFGEQNICYLSTEYFQSQPQQVIDRVTGFLGIENREIDTSRQINSGGKPKSQILSKVTRAMRSYPAVHTFVKGITSQSLREKVRNSNLSTPTMSADTRRKLEAEFVQTKHWMDEKLRLDTE